MNFRQLFNFKPARQIGDVNGYVSDLDAIIEKPVYFKFHGKIFEIKPIETKTFFRFTNMVGAALELQKKPNLKQDELIDFYHAMINSVCENISRKDIEDMSAAQLTAIIDLIMNTVTGKIWGDEKKKMLVPLTQGPQVASEQ